MNIIRNFNTFISESYLNGGRQPLYHSTRYFINILESDLLKINKPTFATNEVPYISFSRNRNFSEYGGKKFMLDADLLFKDGFIAKPIDEIGATIKNSNPSKRERYREYTKSNPSSKSVLHNVTDLKTGEMFNHEQDTEERIYKNISNLGKYVIEIVLEEKYLEKYCEELKNYLTKYPHILVTNIKGDLLMSFDDIEINKDVAVSVFNENISKYQDIEEISASEFNEISANCAKFTVAEIEYIERSIYWKYGASVFMGISDTNITFGYGKCTMDIISDGDYNLYVKEELPNAYYYTKIDSGFGLVAFKTFLNKFCKINK